MKAKLFLSAIVLSALAFTSCDKDDDVKLVSNETKSTFSEMYPNASRVTWDLEGSFQTVDFHDNNHEKEAWFESTGKWVMTETDIRFEELPEAVRTSFASGEYATWRKEDVDMIERPDAEIVYIIDVELNNRDADLHYAPDGVLIKAVAD